MHCDEPILPGQERAEIYTAMVDAHRECSLRSVLGGIGHLLDHRTSALMVDVWVLRKGIDEAVTR
jgi:hypothetical protein